MMRRNFRNDLIIILVAHMMWLAEPAILFAQEANYHPENFTQPVNVARGSLNPTGPGGIYLNHEESCKFVVEYDGWSPDSCSQIEIVLVEPNKYTDSIMVFKPVTDGFVKFNDWESSDASKVIDNITSNYKKKIVDQSRRVGSKIDFMGWRVYPTLDKNNNTMHYATMLNWDGAPTMNIDLEIFDRYGYVPMKIVPVQADLTTEQVNQLVTDAVEIYKSKTGNSYMEFSNGDKVAAYGALGVLATVLGVKYGKAAAVGISALLLILLKKSWLLLFLPLIWVRKLFGRKSD